jgi:hypothetical protein
MHKVLDLDLDFFVWPAFDDTGHGDVSKLPRPARDRFTYLAAEAEIREFLEVRCGLSTGHPLPGHEAQEHLDAFTTWRAWLTERRLSEPFAVVHVDAHSDLGSGLWNNTYHFVSTDLLALPLEARRTPKFGPRHLNSGNYLIGAIANRWLDRLTYVYPVGPATPLPIPDDISEPMTTNQMLRLLNRQRGIKEEEPPPPFLDEWCFQDHRLSTGKIELRQFRDGPDWHKTRPVTIEPSVEFRAVKSDAFSETGFTHLFLARSPQYTPEEADLLLDVIRDYFTEA